VSPHVGTLSRLAVAALLALLLVAPPEAHGAVVQLRTNGGAMAGDLQFTALPGEANLVTVELAGTGPLRVRDAGGGLIAGENCSGGGGEVVCAGLKSPATVNLDITLSDGDDRLTVLGPYASSFIHGSDGSDDISAGAGADSILGGSGDDRLDGGAGDDRLIGGPGADALHGGPGTDTAAFDDHLQAVSVTIDDRADDGAAGEGDDVGTDVENVAGGQGPNRLVGSEGANTLEGGAKADELLGGGGDDHLLAPYATGGLVDGGPGRDSLSVGPESTVHARDGEADSVSCGNGLARVPLVDARDVLAGCVPGIRLGGSRARVDRAGRLRLALACAAVGQHCHVHVTLRWRNRRVARATLALRAGRARVPLRLNRLGRGLLGRHASLNVLEVVTPFRRAPAPSTGAGDAGPLTLRRS
jgi:Ca2+-binding RTX toxin-like protein